MSFPIKVSLQITDLLKQQCERDTALADIYFFLRIRERMDDHFASWLTDMMHLGEQENLNECRLSDHSYTVDEQSDAIQACH